MSLRSRIKALLKCLIGENILYDIARRIEKTTPVSLPAYSKVDVKEKTEEYNKQIQKIIANASKYKEAALMEIKEAEQEKQELTGYTTIYSLLDKIGFVMIKESYGGVKVFRGIRQDRIADFIRLYTSGILQSIAEEGRVAKIKPTHYYTNEFPFIVEIEFLTIVPPVYWSFSMLKEALLNSIIINKSLFPFGFTLLDGNIGNSAFKNKKPCFYDVGSFVKGRKIINEIALMRSVNILMMLSMRECFFSRLILKCHIVLTPYINFDSSLEMEMLQSIFKLYHAGHSCLEYNIIINKIFKKKQMEPAYIDILFADYPVKESLWGTYQKSLFDRERDMRMQRIIELILQYTPDSESCLDLVGNSGYTSFLLAKTNHFKKLTSIDYDENAIEEGRKYLKDEPVDLYLANFMLPVDDNTQFSKIFKSDIVLALAVTHHLILTQNYNIDEIFNRISDLTNKYVFIEFSPLGSYSSNTPEVIPEIPVWYTEEWFEEHFCKFFALLHKEVVHYVTVKNQQKKHRILFIGTCVRSGGE